MSDEPKPDRLAVLGGEEILRAIYGDDLHGCSVSLDEIAGIIHKLMAARSEQDGEILGLYEKVIEALYLLSTPPDRSKVPGAEELQSLLSERLDSIHALTAKTIETLGLLKKQRSGDDSGGS